MKAKFKILTCALLLCFMLTLGITASAEADYALGEDSYVTTQETDTSITELTDGGYEAIGDGDESSNPFAVIYEAALSHASEIFSLLSLIGTLVISYFYKRGLLPSVKGVLGNVSSSVIKLKECSDREIECRKEENIKIEGRLDSFDSALKNQSELISSLESRLISEEDLYRQREKSNLILSSQIDMLYEIFMSSSLPQFQKEAMGERINKMRKELSCYEES